MNFCGVCVYVRETMIHTHTHTYGHKCITRTIIGIIKTNVLLNYLVDVGTKASEQQW